MKKEMGISYKDLDNFILTGEGRENTKKLVTNTFNRTKHKRNPLLNYPNKVE